MTTRRQLLRTASATLATLALPASRLLAGAQAAEDGAPKPGFAERLERAIRGLPCICSDSRFEFPFSVPLVAAGPLPVATLLPRLGVVNDRPFHSAGARCLLMDGIDSERILGEFTERVTVHFRLSNLPYDEFTDYTGTRGRIRFASGSPLYPLADFRAIVDDLAGMELRPR